HLARGPSDGGAGDGAGPGEGRRVDVEDVDRVAGGGEVPGHGPAHAAEADEADGVLLHGNRLLRVMVGTEYTPGASRPQRRASRQRATSSPSLCTWAEMRTRPSPPHTSTPRSARRAASAAPSSARKHTLPARSSAASGV